MVTLSQHSSFSLPASASLTLGGYTGFLPDEWKAGLDTAIQRALRKAGQPLNGLSDNTSWHTNDCIFTAIRQVLFHQFGILLPDDSIFKLYNPSGEGISPECILEAITAVIAPVGVEIERVIVADSVLRCAVGVSPIVADESHANEIDGRAGICMINIGPGYSHAFFWDYMDASAVHSPQFRLAVLLRRAQIQPRSRSVLRSLADYRALVQQALSSLTAHAAVGAVVTATKRLDALVLYANDPDNQAQPGFRAQLETRLEQVAGPLNELFRGQTSRETRAALHAPVMLRQILHEAANLN